MPLVSQTFDQLLDFTRTSAATFVGSNGLIQNTPASVNLLTWTQQFDNAAWPKNGSTVTANTTVAPDGTSTADTIEATVGGAGAPRVYQRPAITGTTTYTISSYFKASGTNFAFLSMRTSGANWTGAEFDLSTGTVTRNAITGNVAYVGATISDVGNGWYRCTVTVTPTDTIAAGVGFIFFGSSDGTSPFVGGFPTFTNTGTETVFIWGAQLEAAAAATSYTRNNGGVFPPRFDYDPVTLAAKGLLIEEQRTNLLTYSNDWTNAAWAKVNATATAAAITSPDGSINGQALTATTSTANVSFIPVAVAATSATFSVYVKQGTGPTVANTFGLRNSTTAVNLIIGTLNYSTGVWTYSTGSTGVTVTDVGNGWWRLQLTATSGITSGNTLLGWTGFIGGAATVGDFLYTYGAQLEAGAFATSYIPTVASQVTRTADQCSIVAPNFAPWYNQSEGTFVAEFDTTALLLGGSSSFYAMSANASGTANHIGLYVFSNFAGGQVRAGGVTQADLNGGGSPTNGAIIKSGIAYATNNVAVTVNGATPATDTSVSLPTVNTLSVGNVNLASQLNGHIRSIRYYPTRLTNAQLQALTA